ncbi:MAG: SAM-dependent methyltransferase [Phenylobacterium zucineum]|nr:MAG: SAM-dependent methyltransferase [Phenylobacterium zucineum]
MGEALPKGARASPSTARNRVPILQVLAPRLPGDARVLEIASGAGEHAVFLAAALPSVRWLPTDPAPEARESIAAWRAAAGLANLEAPLDLDASDPASWPPGPFDGVVCINMIHISPWAATVGLMTGARACLAPGGRLFCYGPFIEAAVETAPSNLAFDASLRSRDPRWGLRQVEAVAAQAHAQGLQMEARIEMPANNLVLVFAKS